MRNKTALFLMLIAISLIFSGCFSSWAGEEGTLIVSIGGGTQARVMAGSVASGDEESDLLHIITITGPGEKQETRFVGSGTASFFIPTGRWNVKVKAYDEAYDDIESLQLVAEGSANVDVRIGDNPVSIKMLCIEGQI